MAEGGNSFTNTIKGGSDEDLEMTCTPCGEDSIREDAVKYCPECQEYLCTTCTKHHGRLKATRAHKLLDKDDARKIPVVAKTKCRYHSDRDIEMYCGTHDMVYCTTCTATEHRSCNGVVRIEDESQKSSIRHAEIKDLIDDADTVQELMRNLNIKKQTNIGSLGKQRDAIQENIKKVAGNLIEHIKKLEMEMMGHLASDYTKMERELESEVSITSHMIQDLENMSKRLQTVSSMDAGQQFIQMKLLKKAVNDANKLHENMESNGTKSVHFVENTVLITPLMKATALGQILTESEERKPAKPRQYKMKSKNVINVNVGNDKVTCHISDVRQLPDGTTILTDCDNSKVKRLGVNFSMQDYCDLVAYPTAVCCIDKNEIAIKMSNNKIQFVSIGSVLSKTRCITIGNGNLFGMAYLSEEFWISEGCGLSVYSRTGSFLKAIDKDQSGKAIFKSRVQHMAVSGDTVIVTDSSDGAVFLNKDGTVKRELRDSRLNTTRGVCVSDDGTVFLSGYKSNNIVMFSSDGKCLGELLGSDAGLKNPRSMCYDKEKHCIIVTCDPDDYIHIVDIRE